MKKSLKTIGIVAAAALCAAGVAYARGAGDAAASGSGSPTLIWWLVGSDSPEVANGARVMSDYLEPRIGARLELRIAGWADQQQRFTTIINSGEYFDLMFDDLSDYSQRVALNAFADLTDLLPQDAPDLVAFIPRDIWTGVKIKGRTYAVPTWKDSAITQWVIWDHDIVTKYNIDITKTDLESMDKYFHAIKAGEGARYYPYRLSNTGSFLVFRNYDTLSAGLPPMGVNLDDPTCTVVNTLDQPDAREILRYTHRWFEDGIINPDAAVSVEEFKGLPFMTSQGWPGADAVWEAQQGIAQYDIQRFVGPNLSTDSIQGSLNTISANSKYKSQALKLLQLANIDPIFRDMLAYGVENTHFSYVKRPVVETRTHGVVHKINTNWPLSAYQQATFFTMSSTDDQPADQWDQVKEADAAARPSPLLGFSLDRASIINEITNCRQVWQRYRNELLCGQSDPDAVIPQINADLKAAGFDKILAEAQRQVNEFLKTK